MYQNTVALPREDLAGPIRTQDMSLSEYIAHLILPLFPVRRKAATIPTVLVTDDQIIDIKHAPKTAYQRVQATLSDEQYNCEEAGIEEMLSAEDYDVLGQDQAEMVATERGMQIVLRGRENALASVLTGATGETTFANQITEPDSGENWGESGGKPIDDVQEADVALTLRIGAGPRWLVIGAEGLADLQKNEQIRAEYRRIVGMTDASATNRRINLDALAQVLGVDKILVGMGRKNTAAKGQTASHSFLWPRLYAVLLRGVTNPSNLTEPTLGRTFVWDGANLGAEAEVEMEDGQLAITVESYRDESKESDVIRVKEYVALKLLNVKAGQLIKLPGND